MQHALSCSAVAGHTSVVTTYHTEAESAHTSVNLSSPAPHPRLILWMKLPFRATLCEACAQKDGGGGVYFREIILRF